MGANQSSDARSSSGAGHRAAGEVAGEVKTCYYDLLGIDDQATEDE